MSKSKKPRKSATMRDVAERAGVSQPTVSRVLSDNNTTISISEETRSKVLTAVAELDYHPNMHARTLRTQRTNMIAVLVADISNSFYPLIIDAIQKVARDRGYDVMIANSNHEYENEIHFFNAISRRTVDGVIIVPIHLTTQELDEFYKRTQTPIAALAQYIQHPSIDVVYINDSQAVYEATLWLIDEKGHRDIGYVGVPDMYPPGSRRRSGFIQAMNDRNLPVSKDFMFESNFTLAGGIEIGKALLKLPKLPTALFVANDLMAIGIILTLQDAGYRIPKDLAVVGFDNIPETMIIRPRLSTVAHDPTDIGYKLATCLFERIENPDLEAQRLQSPYKLLSRDST